MTAGLGGDGGQAGHHLLFVGLVGQFGDAGPALGVIAGRSREGDDRPTLGTNSPFGGGTQRQRARGEAHPVIDPVGDPEVVRCIHTTIVGVSDALRGVAAVPQATFVGNLAAMSPPEGPDEDGGEFGPPLPPEDRLWRHPSEMGRAAMATTPAPAAGAPERRRAGSTWLVGAVAGLSGAVATLAAVVAFGGFDDPVIQQNVVERVASAPTATLPISIGGDSAEGVQAVAAQIAPAVARLEVVRSSPEGSPVATMTATGSGVLFRDDGYLLTSADLVAGARTVAVILQDGEVREGDVVGTDPLTDVGVVKVDGDELPTALLGLVDGLAVGQPALIIGSAPAPGEDPALTSGIISALRRTILADPSGTPTRHDMIQTDAPLDPAATGGALLDARGAVVGITTDPSDQVSVDGLSYATPIDTALGVADQIIATGAVHHPWLGIEGSDIEARTADDLQLAGGAMVATVAENSPAAAAGLSPNDVIISIGAVTVTSMADLVVELRRHDPGEIVLIAYLRDRELGIGVATLGEA